jgi:hypothetical protein
MSAPINKSARGPRIRSDDKRAVQSLLWTLRPLISACGPMPMTCVIAFLAVALDEGKTVNSYARGVGVQRWVMSRYLHILGDRARYGGPGRGLVTVERDADNPRQKKVLLTDKGRELLSLMRRGMQRVGTPPTTVIFEETTEPVMTEPAPALSAQRSILTPS